MLFFKKLDSNNQKSATMPVIRQVLGWSDAADDFMYYISTNPTRDEFAFHKVVLEADDDDVNSLSTLNTLKDFGIITCMDYSLLNEFQCGIGEKDGSVKIFNCMQKKNDVSHLNVDEFDDIYTNKLRKNSLLNSKPDLNENIGDRFAVRSKHPRPVNTLSFGQGNFQNLVAMGLDAHKTNPSLQIWDINYQSSADGFVNNNFEYFPNESIVSSEFIEDNNLLVSSNKLLREIDLRTGKSSFHVPTTGGNEIKVNPFNHNIFATYSESGTSFIWDRRKMKSNNKEITPLLMFNKKATFSQNSASNLISPLNTGNSNLSNNYKKFNHLSFRWSTVKQEEFSTLNNSETIKRWKMAFKPSQNPEHNTYESLFVSSVNSLSLPFDKVVTFDYIPRINNKTTFLCMRTSGTLYRASVGSSVDKVRFNSENDIVTSDYDKVEMNMLQLEKKETLLKYDVDKFYDSDGEEEEEEDEDYESINTEAFMDPNDVLENDISLVMRERALLEYGLDPVITVKILDALRIDKKGIYNHISNQKLAEIRNTWRWIVIAKQLENNTITSTNNLDLGFEGCYGIWNILEEEEVRENRNLQKFSNDELLTEMDMIIKKHQNLLGFGYPLQSRLVTSVSNKGAFKKMIQRKLCMIVSGWDLSNEDVELKYKAIMNLGQYERAAAWAVFFGDIEKCVEILSSSRKERLQLIAAAVAGYSTNMSNSGNNAWREQCRKMGMNLENPYLRAIFTYISDNDWYEIINDPSISIRERLGIALRFLNDKDLTVFLSQMKNTVVSQGQLEGLVFTGITPLGFDLLENYMNKTSDVQTAACIAIYGSPRYFKDNRAEKWADIYKNLLKSWTFFSIKCKFDILRIRVSKNSNGQLTVEQPKRQVSIQCMNCKKLTHIVEQKDLIKPVMSSNKLSMKYSHKIYEDESSSVRKFNSIKNMYFEENDIEKKIEAMGLVDDSDLNNPGSEKYSCQSCGSLYPRCAICLLPLGISNLPIVINGIDTENANDVDNEVLRKRHLKYNEWFQFCLDCNHCMHVGHAEEWFDLNDVCPVPGCPCVCKV